MLVLEAPHVLERSDRGFRSSASELEHPERRRGAVEARAGAEPRGQLERLVDVRAARIGLPLRGLEPRERAERESVIGTVARLPGELDRLVERRRRDVPVAGVELDVGEADERVGKRVDRARVARVRDQPSSTSRARAYRPASASAAPSYGCG